MFRLLVLSIGIASGLGQTVDEGCDAGWYKNDNFCYMFNTNKQVTRQQAFDECDASSGDLLRVESNNELAYIQNIISKFKVDDGFWTGMTDLRFDGTSQSEGFWSWGQYEPVDMSLVLWEQYPTTDPFDSCGAVNINGQFKNWNCSRRLGYICELKQAPGSNGCPDRWQNTYDKGTCFYYSNTSDPSSLLSWQDAKRTCAEWTFPTHPTGKSRLVTMDMRTNSDFVMSEMPEIARTTTMYWTGLKRNGINWVWDDGSTFTQDYVTWASEPDHILKNEHCGMIKTDGNFTDQDCSRQFNFACRKTVKQVNSEYFLGCNGWLRAGHKCYKFYNTPHVTWTSARQHCLSIGTDLLHVQSLDEKRWLEWQLSIEQHLVDYWSGLNDRVSEGAFKWADGSSSDPSLIKWNQEPNSWRGDEDCVDMNLGGVYNDADCYAENYAICEYTSQSNQGQCPSGWKSWPVNNGCYYFTSGNMTKTWDEAHAFCKKTMARPGSVPTTLLAINSKEELAAIIPMLAQQPLTSKGWWTGLNDRKTDGVWTYPEKFNVVDETLLNWYGEPDDKDGTQDCVIVKWGGRYFDYKCNTQTGFICEKPVYGQTAGVAALKPTFVIMATLISLSLFI